MLTIAFYIGAALIVIGLFGKMYERWREDEGKLAPRCWDKCEKAQRRL